MHLKCLSFVLYALVKCEAAASLSDLQHQARALQTTLIVATNPAPTPTLAPNDFVRRQDAATTSSQLWYLAHHCVPYQDPDFNGNSVCQCDGGINYPLNPKTNDTKSYNACYATASPTEQVNKTAAACEVFGPSDCPAANVTIDPQKVIAEAEQKYADDYHRWMYENCTDLQYHYGYPGPAADANGDTCQKIFPIDEHMKWWWDKNGEKCTQHSVGFADCFFDQVPNPHYSSTNCSRLGGNDYCPEPDYKRFGGENSTVEFYIAWNIYNFAIWTNTYYQAIYTSGFLAGQQVWNMTDTFVNPVKGIPHWADVLLYTLTFALGFISPSGWGKIGGDAKGGKGGNPSGILQEAEQAAEQGASGWVNTFKKGIGSFFAVTYQAPWEYVLRGVQQTPAYLDHRLPSATDGKVEALMSAAEVEAQLGFMVEAIGEVMAVVANQVPSNVTALANWTGAGYFYSPPADQQTLTETIKQALNMFVLAQMLLNAEFIITRQVATNPKLIYAEGNNGSMGQYIEGGNSSIGGLDPSFINCPDYDSNGMCNWWWWYEEENIAYALMQPDAKHQHQNYTKNLETLFNLGITTPADLFLSSQICAITAKSAQGPDPGLGTNSTAESTPGSVMTPCLSNLPVCTWTLHDAKTEFQEEGCKEYNDPDFTLPLCKADEPNAPAGYLGYYLYEGITGKCSA